MNISMETIKILREKCGAGMVDCKKALEETGGDIDQAIEILRKKGIAKAAKRSEREASEGVIKVMTNDGNTEGYILEVNAETDFVARNEKFQDFADKIIYLIKESKPKNLEELLKLSMDGGSVGESLDSFSGIIGEKLQIRRFEVIKSEGTVGAYSHMGGKIGILVDLNKAGMEDLAIDMAMQVAATNPKYLDRSEVPNEEIEKEKAVYREQLLREGKPEAMIEKIMEGKINKYFEDVCLVDQDYIKDDKKKVREILGEVKITRFARYSL